MSRSYDIDTTQCKVGAFVKLLNNLSNDKELYNVAVGYMADGDFPDIMNLTVLVDESDAVGGWVDPDSEDSLTRNIDNIKHSTLYKLESDFEIARRDAGWDRYSSSKRKKRAAWERRYYGRSFDGTESGLIWAEKVLMNHISSF